MHTCEVSMRYDLDAPDESLLPCGSPANKKMGLIWVCDFHYDMFRYSIDAGDTDGCHKAMDSTSCSDDDYDTYFELGEDFET